METITEMLAYDGYFLGVEKTIWDLHENTYGIKFHLDGDTRSCPVYYPKENFWRMSTIKKTDTLLEFLKEVGFKNLAASVLNEICSSKKILKLVKPLLIREEKIEAYKNNRIAVCKDETSGLGMIFTIRTTNRTILINDSMLVITGIDLSELQSSAIKNMEEDCFIKKMDNIWSVSSKEQLFGAGAIFTEKAKKELATIFGNKPYFVIPFSIHCVLIVKHLHLASLNGRRAEPADATITALG